MHSPLKPKNKFIEPTISSIRKTKPATGESSVSSRSMSKDKSPLSSRLKSQQKLTNLKGKQEYGAPTPGKPSVKRTSGSSSQRSLHSVENSERDSLNKTVKLKASE